ncbi:MAG: RNA-binding cell elongation regulator Jag/EloR [Candidatus Cloacimonadales bacterium]|jgi:spoIIIJ-associated protein|nr:Jag N-terminal domain-containing protein [Candidatus Cloacimonadota bacterium]MDD2650801.1 Jag N-terminal domain-containing protein [Candidatus Cloacimonadota bacterium]MDX9976711.1 RNA-binding cell elongation regulator Jag/EloR [Candidatus Cloacimonadales bacterium]MDY0196165.1 RNA-binding cell elongation regulator Jag/EloR [Sulfurovaceae bacterium]
MKTIEKTAKTVELAIDEFKSEYNLEDKQFKYEVVQEPKNAFLGFIGGADAIVRFTILDLKEEIRNYLYDFMNLINMDFSMIEIENDDNNYMVRINNPSEPGFIIGKDGNFLNDLEYLLNLAIFKNQDVNGKVVLDVDTYRQRRAEALAREAKIAMSRVLKSRTSIKMKPLISAERRMIHNQVHQDKRFRTSTIGDGRKRQVIISLSKSRHGNRPNWNKKNFKSGPVQAKKQNTDKQE